MILYSDIKTFAQAQYGEVLSAGNFIETDAGSPTELAILLTLVHSRIVGYPHTFPFCKVVGTITLDGSQEYNLRTLFPDLISVTQVYGIASNRDQEYVGNAEANITSKEGFTIRNGKLIFTGQAPNSGTVKLQYKSQYLVEDANGVRKKFFEEDTDYSVLPFGHLNVLLMGLGNFVQWKTDEVSKEKRKETKSWFQEAWTNLLLDDEIDDPIDNMLG